MANKISLRTSLRVAGYCLVLTGLLGSSGARAQKPGSLPLNSNSTVPLTVILVRHAEKAVVPPENKNPDLSTAGQARAEQLMKMFGGSGIGAIYATQFKRTQQTVKPLAEKLGLTVTQVEASKTSDLVKLIRARGAGAVVFLAGHNNSVPEIIAALGGPKLPIIPETEYDNMFILTVQSDGSAKLLKMKY